MPADPRPAFACVLVGGPIHRIHAGSRIYTFEMHPACGPAVVGRNGDPLATQPGERSPFWTAVTLWVNQGQRVDASGLCLWDAPPPRRLKHITGRDWMLVGPDEPCDREDQDPAVIRALPRVPRG